MEFANKFLHHTLSLSCPCLPPSHSQRRTDELKYLYYDLRILFHIPSYLYYLHSIHVVLVKSNQSPYMPLPSWSLLRIRLCSCRSSHIRAAALLSLSLYIISHLPSLPHLSFLVSNLGIQTNSKVLRSIPPTYIFFFCKLNYIDYIVLYRTHSYPTIFFS